jgi:hypothetical protein
MNVILWFAWWNQHIKIRKILKQNLFLSWVPSWSNVDDIVYFIMSSLFLFLFLFLFFCSLNLISSLFHPHTWCLHRFTYYILLLFAFYHMREVSKVFHQWIKHQFYIKKNFNLFLGRIEWTMPKIKKTK